jgi:cell division protein FtsB
MNNKAQSKSRENVLSLQLARDHAWQERGGSNAPVGPSANQRSLERLEAENAGLRASVVELVLQIQALRDGAK